MGTYSTGKLTEEKIQAQNRIYQEGHKWDYAIVGTGMSALSIGSMLAKDGFKVCLIEAHDVPGGYAHTFEMNDFHFCAQVHYIWGCASGEPIYEFLKYIGLEKDITFNLYDAEGYDHMVMPDGKKVKIPYGYDQAAKNIEDAYPGQKEGLKQFFSCLENLSSALSVLPTGEISIRDVAAHPKKFWTLYKYKDKTLQQVFNECNVSKEAQAILNANTGDLMCPPEKLSIFAYLGLFGGYNKGAYYPKKHFKYFTERLAQFITDHSGCHIFYESEVVKIKNGGDSIVGLETKDGKVFQAKNYICNMDPQKASTLIGRDKFPKEYLNKVSYDYSPSSLIIYLGIKGIDLRDYGFGNHNTWHLEQWDINKIWKDIENNNYEKPWIFYSTPTLHSDHPGVAPEGCQILELGTAANYSYFKNLHEKNPASYRKEKRALAEKLIQITSQKYIPNLEKHIVLKVVGSPLTNERFCYAPYGNCYGSHMTPKNMGIDRLSFATPWKNFYWCNASSGYPGVYGTTLTGMRLHQHLKDSLKGSKYSRASCGLKQG